MDAEISDLADGECRAQRRHPIAIHCQARPSSGQWQLLRLLRSGRVVEPQLNFSAALVFSLVLWALIAAAVYFVLL